MVEGLPSLYECDVQTVVDFLEFLRETEHNTYIKGTQWEPVACLAVGTAGLKKHYPFLGQGIRLGLRRQKIELKVST